MTPRFILASNSPRRRELLSMLGMDFTVKVSDCDESVTEGTLPADMVRKLALRKAMAVADSIHGDGSYIVIAADTVVADGTRILGKPTDEEDAYRALMSLSGRSHSVFTGLALVLLEDGKAVKTVADAVETEVVFADLNEEEVRFYAMSGEPLDKAGSYGIQGLGGFFVKELHGDYYNVVGLPIARLRTMLADEFGIAPSDYLGKKQQLF